MLFNATFNNISVISIWRSVLLVEETGVPGENHRHIVNHWQTLSHNIVHLSWAWFELTTLMVIGTDCIGSCKSNYHTTTTSPKDKKKLYYIIFLIYQLFFLIPGYYFIYFFAAFNIFKNISYQEPGIWSVSQWYERDVLCLQHWRKVALALSLGSNNHQ